MGTQPSSAAAPGGECPLSDQVAVTPARDMDLLDLEAALDKLGTINPRLIDLVVMRFFGGLTIEEAAEAVQSSPATVKRDWIRARAWLFRELSRKVAARSDRVSGRQPRTSRPRVHAASDLPLRDPPGVTANDLRALGGRVRGL